MSHLHDDADPVEHDPTGMRALLGSLPDPGPMPEDLVARITAALAEESHREGVASGWSAPAAPTPAAVADVGVGDPGDVVVPLRRRRVWQVLGAAAAAVVVLGVGGLVVEQLSGGDLQASLGLTQGGSSDSAAMAGAGAEADRALASGGGVLAWDESLHVVVVATGTEYTGSTLAARAQGLEPSPSSPSSAPSSPYGPGDTVASPAGARACATAVGVGPSTAVVVDLARFDGHSAAVLVATATDGTREAWAVARDCRVGAPGVLAGPVEVP